MPDYQEHRYLTDDRDARPDRRVELIVGFAPNGDYYLGSAPVGEHPPLVRICNSGGAASRNPRLVRAVRELFEALGGWDETVSDGGEEIRNRCQVAHQETHPCCHCARELPEDHLNWNDSEARWYCTDHGDCEGHQAAALRRQLADLCRLVINSVADAREALPGLGLALKGTKHLGLAERIEKNLNTLRNAVPKEFDHIHHQIQAWLGKATGEGTPAPKSVPAPAPPGHERARAFDEAAALLSELFPGVPPVGSAAELTLAARNLCVQKLQERAQQLREEGNP